jgi:hypothetical protein
MRVNKLYIENQLKDLNEWLTDNPGHELQRIKKQRLSYYAMKAQEMEEQNLQTIKV